MPNISVIIPVYNSAKYLDECLTSVIVQSIKNIEIICINDGSADDSLEILQKFKKEHSEIIVIDQKNKGVSAARNAGLKIAKGKYVGFVDSDDTVAPDFFENLYKAAIENDCDVVYSQAFAEDILKKNRIYSREEIIQLFLPQFLEKDFYNSVCNKLYRYELIMKNSIHFPTGKKLGEDANFNLQFLEFTNQLFYLDFQGYFYREVSGSATRNVAVQNYLEETVNIFHENSLKFISSNLSSQDIEHFKSMRFMRNIISLVYIYSEPKNGLTYFQKLKKLRELVSTPTVIKVFGENEEKSIPDLKAYRVHIFNLIKSRNVFALNILSLYSYYKNL